MIPPVADQRTDLRHYIDILYQRRLLVIIVFTVTFLMIMISYVVTPPIYTAQAKILIEPELSTSINTSNRGKQVAPLYFSTQLTLIRSEPVLYFAASELGLHKGNRDFDSTIARLKRDITVDRVGGSRIFTISVKSKNSSFSVNATNAMADGYIKFLNEQRKRRISDITLWLQGELASLKNKVEKTDMKLIKYVEQQEVKGSSDVIMFLGDPSDNAGATALSELETKYITSQIRLTNLLQKYKDKYPLVIQLKNDLSALNIKIAMMKQAMITANKRRIKYLMLKRDSDLSKDMYSMLTKELKEINVFGEIGYPTATIIEHADSQAAKSGRGFLFWIFFGLLASAVVGVVSAVIADQIDNTIKDEADIERFIKYSVIGRLPYVDEFKHIEPQKILDLLHSASLQTYTEALRLIRTNLKYSFVGKPGKVLLVTSTRENEGKTTLCAGLAYILSITGAKVLLLDGDGKKPSIHKLFNGEQMPGYTELLIDEKLYIADVIRQSGYNSLYYLTAGRQPPNFAELIDSARAKEFIELLRTKFDYVIIDSPPIGIVSDAAILSSQADGVIFVVKAGGYPREHVIKSIKTLTSLNIKITGIALTFLEKGTGYYKYYHYGKE